MSGRLAVVGWWAALLAGGCFDPDVPVGLPCTADRRCPDGQSCDPNTNTCELPAADQLWRACDAAAACAAEPWTVVASGAVPAVTPRRFGQYQLELLGDGDVPTALDWIELAYRAR